MDEECTDMRPKLFIGRNNENEESDYEQSESETEDTHMYENDNLSIDEETGIPITQHYKNLKTLCERKKKFKNEKLKELEHSIKSYNKSIQNFQHPQHGLQGHTNTYKKVHGLWMKYHVKPRQVIINSNHHYQQLKQFTFQEELEMLKIENNMEKKCDCVGVTHTKTCKNNWDMDNDDFESYLREPIDDSDAE
jgi:hypothetical protein